MADKTKIQSKPPSEFIAECRELRKKGATHEQWEYAALMMEACDRYEAAEAEVVIIQGRRAEAQRACKRKAEENKQLTAKLKEAEARENYIGCLEGTLKERDKEIKQTKGVAFRWQETAQDNKERAEAAEEALKGKQ